MIASARLGFLAASPRWGSLRVAIGIGTLVRVGSWSSLTWSSLTWSSLTSARLSRSR